jgi:hypothetical protein
MIGVRQFEAGEKRRPASRMEAGPAGYLFFARAFCGRVTRGRQNVEFFMTGGVEWLVGSRFGRDLPGEA